MFNEDGFEKKVTMRFVETLNRHLAVKRKTLKELLAEEKPSIKNRDGFTHHFDKKELLKIAAMIPETDHSSLRLPIYLEMSSSLERGTIMISGRVECLIIRKILYGEEAPEKAGGKDKMTIYYPHLKKIRKELSTVTQFMFTM
jgi:uncharacterized protein (UPF0216 family)